MSGSARAPGATAGVLAGTSRRCITIGPFADPERAKDASDLLRERGFSPRQRAAPTGTPDGYWVYIAGFKSAADEANVLQRLERNGITDAKAMPASAGDRRVSVGLFTDRGRAERRARVVRSLGLDAEVEPRQSAPAQWVDVDLDSSTQSLPAEGLLSLEETSSRLEIKECPSATQDAGTKPSAPPATSPTRLLSTSR